MALSKKNYIIDIDGLRGISVLSVVLYHFFPNIFMGGFIGVDIFFVISGFVISKILIEEFDTKKKISLKNFYIKRIKRIFPAFFLIIFVSSIFSYFILLPEYLLDFSQSSLSSIFFSSNFYFFLQNADYAGIASNFKPLLHLWSLSVEEQFYIFFPFFLFLYLKIFRKKFFVFGIVIFSTLIYFFSLIIEQYYFRSSFYLFPTRSFQFLIGCLIAKIYIDQPKNKKHIIDNFVPTIFYASLSSLFLFIFFFSDKHLYPSYYTLIPVISSGLIIYLSIFHKFDNKILSNNYLVWFGKISYSLYLWHYPIFVYANYLDLLESNLNKLFFLTLAIILSYISYNFYEKQFRYYLAFSKTLIISSLFFVISMSYSFLSIKTGGFSDRVPEILSKSYELITYDLKDRDKKICYDRIKDFCHINKGNSNTKIAIIGDSHMGIVASKLNKMTNFEIITLNNSACYFLPNFYLVFENSEKEHKDCNNNIQQERLKKLASLKDYIIIIGGRLPLYLTGKPFDNLEGGKSDSDFRKMKLKNEGAVLQDEIIKPIIELAKKNKVIILYPIPELGWDIKKKILNKTNKIVTNINKDFVKNFPIITTSNDVFIERNKESYKILDSISHENVLKVYPHKFFCDNQIKNRCVANDKKDLFYFDSHHLSDRGVEIVVEMILLEIKKLNKNMYLTN